MPPHSWNMLVCRRALLPHVGLVVHLCWNSQTGFGQALLCCSWVVQDARMWPGAGFVARRNSREKTGPLHVGGESSQDSYGSRCFLIGPKWFCDPRSKTKPSAGYLTDKGACCRLAILCAQNDIHTKHPTIATAFIRDKAGSERKPMATHNDSGSQEFFWTMDGVCCLTKLKWHIGNSQTMLFGYPHWLLYCRVQTTLEEFVETVTPSPLTRSSLVSRMCHRPRPNPLPVFKAGYKTADYVEGQSYLDYPCDPRMESKAKVENMVYGMKRMAGIWTPKDSIKLYMALVEAHLIFGFEFMIDSENTWLEEHEDAQKQFISRGFWVNKRLCLVALFTERGALLIKYGINRQKAHKATIAGIGTRGVLASGVVGVETGNGRL
ncbi:hypothetical protein BKA70DRAFT_1410463 [Coprinopsis sp. MPI-PUGE-AT-0042]|nr:hypothetical protein BKA70DRAFT_1410463 [Coprinopsis sp. MPI-PUGE-AT-0042]